MCCNETFTDVDSLKNHIHDLIAKIKCTICNKQFKNLSSLANHINQSCIKTEKDDTNNVIEFSLNNMKVLEQESKDVPMEYYCEICDIYFNEMESHLQKYHNGENIVLEEQKKDAEYSDEEMLESVDDIEDDESTYTEDIGEIKEEIKSEEYQSIIIVNETASKNNVCVCEKCGYTTSNLLKFKSHSCVIDYQDGETLATNIDSENNCKTPKKSAKIFFKCDICLTQFTHFKSLAVHKKMHIKPSDTNNLFEEEYDETQIVEKFHCKICGKIYGKEFEEDHMKSHQKMTIACGICNRNFTDKMELDLHARLHNIDKTPYCTICKSSFETEEQLSEHYKEHSEKRKFNCSFCSKTFSKPNEQLKHERVHTGYKPHTCEVCGKKFRVQYCLTLHLRTHTGQRPYTCEKCGKKFKSYSVYNHHMKTHSDARPYQCPYCPKTFKTNVQLAGHKNCHTKPFNCTECNRPFASLYAVRNHMEIHKRSNSFQFDCKICGAVYARGFALRDHLLTLHSENKEAVKELETLMKKEKKKD